MAAKKIELTVSIKGEDWLIRLRTHKSYIKDHGDDSAGITLYYKRIIDINKSGYTFDVILHELFHAFIRECNAESSDLSTLQMEELCCSLVGNNIFDLLSVAFKIQTHFQLNA